MPEQDTVLDAARAVERLRLAEARLARRRQTQCGPSETARAATRFIFEKSDAGQRVTPRKVKVGLHDAQQVQILSGLAAGDKVLVGPVPDAGKASSAASGS